MKKFLFSLIITFSPLLLYAEEVKINGIYYNLSESSAEVVWNLNINDEYKGKIVIPDMIVYGGKEYVVTSIGRGAFGDCLELTSVSIPASVTSIGECAFWYSENIVSIDIPNSVNTIGDYAFRGCSSLTHVNLPNGLTRINQGLFEGCSSLSSIIIPQSVTAISSEVFYDCISLSSIIIPKSVIHFNNFFNGRITDDFETNIFEGCSNLKSIVVEEGNPVFDSRENCNAIINTASNTILATCQNSVIPQGITRIGRGAFSRCANLKSISIPNSVKSIGISAIGGCPDLEQVYIPYSVSSIENGAFGANPKLLVISIDDKNSVFDSRNNCNAVIETSNNKLIRGCKGTIIPDGITTIGRAAFGSCTELTSLTIPNSINTIESGAFQYCEKLKSLYIPNSVTNIEDMIFFLCTNSESINIPTNIKKIASYMFAGCESLKSIVIPAGVEKIDYAAFCECTNLRDVYCYAQEIPVATSAFLDCNLNEMTLHVPEGYVETYKSMAPWNSFKEIVPLRDGDPDPTALSSLTDDTKRNNTWYDLKGRKLNGEPKTKGFFIKNGKKVLK